MVSEKYAAMGFNIAKFGLHSSVLKFEEKPIFVFESAVNIDEQYFNSICKTYLKLTSKRKELSCIKAC
jgi:hypothetical protein